MARAVERAQLVAQVGDLQAELARIWPIIRWLPRARGRRDPPALVVRRRRTGDPYWVRAFAVVEEHRVHMAIPERAYVASVHGVLVHELAHLVVPARSGPAHTPMFWRILALAIERAYGARVPDLEYLLTLRTHYARQAALEQALWTTGRVPWPERPHPAAVHAALSRVERRLLAQVTSRTTSSATLKLLAERGLVTTDGDPTLLAREVQAYAAIRMPTKKKR